MLSGRLNEIIETRSTAWSSAAETLESVELREAVRSNVGRYVLE